MSCSECLWRALASGAAGTFWRPVRMIVLPSQSTGFDVSSHRTIIVCSHDLPDIPRTHGGTAHPPCPPLAAGTTR
eukprot:4461753-Prymnesium_polylepis.1